MEFKSTYNHFKKASLLSLLLFVGVSLFAQTTWMGATDTDWNTASNWNPAFVPTADDDVTIPDVANDPNITAAAVAKSVHVQTGGVLTFDCFFSDWQAVSKTARQKTKQHQVGWFD